MALQRLVLPIPVHYRGLEDFAPKEVREIDLELIRRLDVNQQTLINALQEQAVADPDILPPLDNGASKASDQSVSTSQDVQDSLIHSQLWNS